MKKDKSSKNYLTRIIQDTKAVLASKYGARKKPTSTDTGGAGGSGLKPI